MRKSISLFLAVGFAIGFSLSCGKNNKNSKYLQVSVSPTKSYILPGNSANCSDYKALASASDGALGASVAPHRVFFPSFALRWDPQTENGNSSDTTVLTVAQITLTIKHSSLSPEEYVCTISGAELDNLLARPLGVVDPRTLPTASPNPYRTLVSNSTSDPLNRGTSGTDGFYPACGFACGSIKIKKEKEKQGFSATGTIEVLAFSQAADGTQAPERTDFPVQVEYLGN